MDDAVSARAKKAHRVCPWWLGYCLMCPLFRLGQNPRAILAPYVRAGSTVLEPGPGMGFFTLELARLVGPTGRVIAVDIQPKMLERLKRRASKAGLLERLDARLASEESMGLADLHGAVDFSLAFAVVHELPDRTRFFAEMAQAAKPGALLLLAEPKGHVKDPEFDSELRAASEAGFESTEGPAIRGTRTALLRKR
jgi:SAM-dependent methyltransferase